MERVAAIDIGTNTTLLLIAERGPDGTLRAVFEDATITRLGQGVDRTRTFAPEAIARTVACLEKQAIAITTHGTKRPGGLRVTGTSAMRDAKGAEEIRACVRARLGVDVEVIAGDEEARLAFVGAMSGLSSFLGKPSSEREGKPSSKAPSREREGKPSPKAPSREREGWAMVLDVGGGSTELVRGIASTGQIEEGTSFDVGSVRMTERHVHSDPPTPAELRAVEEDVQKTLSPWSATSETLVGVAGTVTTMASIFLGLTTYDGARIHGSRLSRADVEAVATKLAALPLAERSKLPGLDPKRADVIVAGAIIVRVAMDKVGAKDLLVSDRGLRWAVCEELSSSAR